LSIGGTITTTKHTSRTTANIQNTIDKGEPAEMMTLYIETKKHEITVDISRAIGIALKVLGFIGSAILIYVMTIMLCLL
jgi:ABC-type transport system involved in Fe-S cluster assembly fused permease/ATPase subunit